MRSAVLVALGGMIGSVLRYLVGGVVQNLSPGRFPFGTLFVNVVGSFALGAIMFSVLERQSLGNDARAFLAIGFCGGFTTMSTFSYEIVVLLRQGSAATGLLYLATTVAACLGAVWLGAWAARA